MAIMHHRKIAMMKRAQKFKVIKKDFDVLRRFMILLLTPSLLI
jgi:hypothetical protein